MDSNQLLRAVASAVWRLVVCGALIGIAIGAAVTGVILWLAR